MTMKSTVIASSVRAVSRRVSPFTTEEAWTLMFTTSAESRTAASSKEVRVRVLAS
jgi:hypothetical protein